MARPTLKNTEVSLMKLGAREVRVRLYAAHQVRRLSNHHALAAAPSLCPLTTTLVEVPLTGFAVSSPAANTCLARPRSCRHVIKPTTSADGQIKLFPWPIWAMFGTHRKPSHGLVVLLHHGRVLCHGVQPFRVRAAKAAIARQIHRNAAVERTEPAGIDVRDRGQDGVEVVDALQGLDLERDGGFGGSGFREMSCPGSRGVSVRAWNEAEGWGGARASILGAVFGGADDVLGLLDRVDPRDYDGCAGVESIPDSGVVVAPGSGRTV